MKKKVFLSGVAAAAAIASLTLVSCGGGNTPTTTTTTGGTPTTTAPVESKVDVFLNYNGNKGITYRANDNNLGTTHTNPIDGITYKEGDLLPVWKKYQEKLNVKFNDLTDYSKKKNDEVYNELKNKDNGWTINGEEVDLFYNSVGNIIDMGGQKVVNLKDYIDAGKMPNFKKYLEDHPEMKKELEYGTEKAIYFTPYLDGYNDIEKVIMMDTKVVELLLDADLDALPATLGQLPSGHGATANAKGQRTIIGDPQITPFIDADHNYPATTTTVKVNNGTTNKDLVIKQTTNIIKQQNELLAAGTTGRALLEQMQDYIDAAFGDEIGANKTYAKRSEIFTTVKAAYNTDELLALMRVFKANPDILFYDVTKDAAQATENWSEVEALFPRGAHDTRIQDVLSFFGNIFGVQGIGSEKDHLYFTNDGKMHDAETTKASYQMLALANSVYQEGLLKKDFFSATGLGDKEYVERYFNKIKADKSSFGLVMYDYIATQSAANDKVNGLGTNKASRQKNVNGLSFADYSVTGVRPILSPLTYWATGNWSVDNDLTGNNGVVNTTGKTLIRHYEENRALKTDSWCIPLNSDNKEGAVKVIDYLFSEEGNRIHNYGPEEYWTMGTVFGKQNPVLKTVLYDDYAGKGDIWNYLRGIIGSTLPVGHVRPTALDFQVTNQHAQAGYTDIQQAVASGAQSSSLCKTEFKWNTTVPTTCYPIINTTVAKTYEALNPICWNSNKNKADTAKGWISLVVAENPFSNPDFVFAKGSTHDYKLSELEDIMETKNHSYLAQMTASVNRVYGVDVTPNEAKQQ